MNFGSQANSKKESIISLSLASNGVNYDLQLSSLLGDFYIENQSIIKKEVEKCLNFCISQSWSSFTHTLEIRNYMFSLALDLENKEIFLYTQRLSQELVLSEFDSDYKSFCEKIKKLKHQNYYPIKEISFKHKLSLENIDLSPSGQVLGLELYKKVKTYKFNLFERFSNYFLDLTSQYDLIRIHILKFIAIIPCLDHDIEGDELKRLFIESLEELISDNKEIHKSRKLPFLITTLTSIVLFMARFIPAKTLSLLIKNSTQFVASLFIAGKDIVDASQVLQNLNASSREATIDQLGELVLTKAEADHYTSKVIEIIEGLGKDYKKGERNSVGILKAQVSIKVSALGENFIPHAYDYSEKQILPRLKKIFRACIDQEVFLNIDAEHYHYRDTVWKIYSKLLAQKEFENFSDTGIVIQAYLKDAYEHFLEITEFNNKRSSFMPIRLVKGAYWDAEVVETKAHSQNSYQFLNKFETDINFRLLIMETIKSESLQLCVASHNIFDHAFAEDYRNTHFPESLGVEHQCLHMTYEALSIAMAEMNWAVRNYVPVGNLLVGMSYLVRRIMENSSQVGFLTQSRQVLDFTKMRDFEDILKLNNESLDHNDGFSAEFFNHPPLDFFLLHSRKQFESQKKAALETLKMYSEGDHEVRSPSSREVIGKINFYNKEDAPKLINRASEAFKNNEWSLSFENRSKALLNFSEKLKQERDLFSHIIMIESGKTVLEALADVDEAIDFVDYYVREQSKHRSSLAMGVSLIIAPWNFPLAIACGMSVAALVSGNSVILKSSEKTPLIADIMVKLLHQSGVPKDILIHAPGYGHEIGQALTESARVSNIVFTGSKKVGCMIYEANALESFSHLKDNKTYKKRVITEMGGKNAIIVSNNCELDETISGVIYSAFAHAGQKCSACSKVYVHKNIAEKFSRRLAEAVGDLHLGLASQYETMINPLITEFDKKRVLSKIQEVKKSLAPEDEVLIDRSEESDHPYVLGPFIFKTDIDSQQKVFNEEFFAPVLQVITYEFIEKVYDDLNKSEYGLTGGIFSQSFREIDEYCEKAPVGNIYINRPNTGARVAIEPFGGFKMSGSGPKAGGRNYLSAFQISQKSQDNFNPLNEWINQEIPGQDNITSLSQKVEGLVFFIQGSKSMKSVAIEKLARSYGVSIHQVSKAETMRLVDMKSISIVIDGDQDYYNSIAQEISPINGDFLLRVEWIQSSQLHSSHDASDFLSYSRAMAINTMRHGAPLSVN